MITSPSNSQVKAIRKLSQHKYRKESGLFYVEGLRLIASAFENQAYIEEIVYCAELLESRFGKEILQQAAQDDIQIIEVSRSVFNSISLKENPQGIAAVVRQNVQPLLSNKLIDGLWVALEGVQDPGNLGSILRTLDAVGGKGVILIGEGTEAFHPTSVRARMGAIFTLQLLQTNKEIFIQWKDAHKIDLIGAICTEGRDYRSYNYANNTILLMGSEQKGLSGDLKSFCTTLVTIPMCGSVDSLNLANAASIILYEIYNQHFPLRKE